MDDHSKLYKYRLYSTGKFYPKPLVFYTDAELVDKTGFASLYKVTKETADALIEEGSIKGFKGVVWDERLWLDIDNGEDADKVEARLNEMGVSYISYFSGRAGAHFGIKLGASPSFTLPLRSKQWVCENFNMADTSIFSPLHLFRLPGTKHDITGLKKSLVGQVEGKPLSIEDSVVEKDVGNDLHIGPELTSNGSRSVFSSFLAMAKIYRARNGRRHHTLVAFCYALKSDCGLGYNETRFLVHELNRYFPEPKDEADVDKIVRSIFG